MTLRFPVDDPIHRLDSRWMGFGGPFRYITGVLFLVYGVAVLVVRTQLGVPFTPVTAAFLLAVAVGLTKVTTRWLNHDRKLRAVLATLKDEVEGPRAGVETHARTRLKGPRCGG